MVKFDQLSSRYKNAKCLNLNHCISDNADLNKSIVNKYISLDADTYSKEEMEVFAMERRKELNVSDEQKLLLMGAYITEPDYERFKKYPEVIMIDCTHNTNDEEGRELCTATSKDRHNNVYPISRCALPNSRNMIFHWLFSTFYKKFISHNSYVIE